MNKEQFIEALHKNTELSYNQCVIVNDIIEGHMLIGKKNQDQAVSEIMDRLHCPFDQSKHIFDCAMSMITAELKDKIKHPFHR